jgi:hypothetical protein
MLVRWALESEDESDDRPNNLVRAVLGVAQRARAIKAEVYPRDAAERLENATRENRLPVVRQRFVRR